MARWASHRIRQWPGKLTVGRRTSPFRSTWGATMDLLERELAALNAKDVVVQRAFKVEDERLDGEPRPGARPEHPGVILSFVSKTGPLQFACDRFTSWEDNIRAIALGLEALRKIDRYGIGQGAEQYAGWKTLHAGADATWAKAWIEDHGGTIKAALQATHPDHGGTSEDFQRTQEARKVLGAGTA